MTDDEARVARLNALAHELWPDHEVMRFEATEGGVICKYIAPSPWGSIMSQPRALDGMEALLLTLADEARIPLTADQVTRDALKSCERDREALTARIRKERAAMEKLAEEWEVKARTVAERCIARLPRNAFVGPLSDIITGLIDALASELRERATRCE